jgi:hypothetical protein
VDYDVRTITANDYTVEFDLEVKTYESFFKGDEDLNIIGYYDKTNPMSEIAQFKLYIQHEFERRINLMPDLGFRDAD